MEDVKAELKSPPPPKQQVRDLFLPDLHLQFLFLCLLPCHLVNPAYSLRPNQFQLTTASQQHVSHGTLLHPGTAANA